MSLRISLVRVARRLRREQAPPESWMLHTFLGIAGQEYTAAEMIAAPTEAGARPGTPASDVYRIITRHRPGWRYVEGLIFRPTMPALGWIHHAWALDPEGRRCDPGSGAGTEYVGYPMSQLTYEQNRFGPGMGVLRAPDGRLNEQFMSENCPQLRRYLVAARVVRRNHQGETS